MKTEVLKVGTDSTADIVSLASKFLQSGELVAIPTETVYGLAGNALSPDASRKIYAVKGRPSDNPLIVHISDISQLYLLTATVPDKALALAERFWPGPLTMVFKKSDIVPDTVSGGLDTVAVRLPDCEITREIISHSVPLAAPSANLSGSPSPTSAEHVYSDLNGRIPLIVDGGDCRVGVESTVITFAEDIPTILRPGGVTREEIEEVIGRVALHSAVTEVLESDEKATSPGMKYKHYAPNKKIVLLDCDDKQFIKYLNLHCFENIGALIFDEDKDKINLPSLSLGRRGDAEAHAHNLFALLRECDSLDCDTIYAQTVHKTGISLAVYNRLIRAAAHNIIKPDLPMIIGMTGPSGAGKSLLSQEFWERGFVVIEADKISRQTVEKESDTLKELAKEFGEEIILQDGTLDREKLSKLAFANPYNTEKLNAITHPAIIRRIIDNINDADCDKILIDAPLLFESGLDRICDKTIGVIAPLDDRIKRVAERDRISEDNIKIRFSAGKDDDYYRSRCDIIINNTDLEKSKDAVQEAIDIIFDERRKRL